MKKLLFFLLSAIGILVNGCSSGDATAYKDLVFGMSVEEVKAKGFCDGEQIRIEDGMNVYECKYSDFAGIDYERAELAFRNDKLAKVHFYNSTYSPEYQRKISKEVTDYLTSKMGSAQTAGKCDGWRDSNRTYLLYIHVDLSDLSPKYINELAICSNQYYKQK